jgi:membrane protein YqaA with SNARE-associated domain
MIGGLVVLVVTLGGTIGGPLGYWLAKGCPHADD